MAVQTRFPLIVGLTRTPSADNADAQAVDAQVGAAVQVVITSADFAVIGERVKPLLIQAEADSTPAVFYLRAPQVGMGTVLIDFWYGGQILASGKRTIKAQAQVTVVTSEHAAGQPLALAPPQVPYPDLILRVTTADNRLHYDLHFADTQFLHFAGDPLRADPEKFRYNLIEEIESLAGQPDQPADFVTRQLAKIGQRLYRDLLPVELRREYRRFRKQVCTPQIISDEPWIPWELIKPFDGEDSQDIVDDDFLCVQYDFTRWFTPARPPAQAIAIHSLACIAPTDSLLPAAQAEQQMLRGLATANGYVDHTPPLATFAAVEQLLGGDQPIKAFAQAVRAGQSYSAGLQCLGASQCTHPTIGAHLIEEHYGKISTCPCVPSTSSQAPAGMRCRACLT